MIEVSKSTFMNRDSKYLNISKRALFNDLSNRSTFFESPSILLMMQCRRNCDHRTVANLQFQTKLKDDSSSLYFD